MTQRLAILLRGINVGKGKRVAMADLRVALEQEGYAEVRTLLNSGNVVLTASAVSPGHHASLIESLLERQLGLRSRVAVLTLPMLDRIIAENVLLPRSDNHSRLMVAAFVDASRRDRALALRQEDWGTEACHVGEHAAYLWCPAGVLESPLSDAVAKAMGDTVTSRNWNTVLKIRSALGA